MVEQRLADEIEVTVMRLPRIMLNERNLELAPADGLARARNFINDFEYAASFELRQALADSSTEQVARGPSARGANRNLIYVGASQLRTAPKPDRRRSMLQQLTEPRSSGMWSGARGVSNSLLSQRSATDCRHL